MYEFITDKLKQFCDEYAKERCRFYENRTLKSARQQQATVLGKLIISVNDLNGLLVLGEQIKAAHAQAKQKRDEVNAHCRIKNGPGKWESTLQDYVKLILNIRYSASMIDVDFIKRIIKNINRLKPALSANTPMRDMASVAKCKYKQAALNEALASVVNEPTNDAQLEKYSAKIRTNVLEEVKAHIIAGDFEFSPMNIRGLEILSILSREEYEEAMERGSESNQIYNVFDDVMNASVSTMEACFQDGAVSNADSAFHFGTDHSFGSNGF